jgi:Flp pilus assembly protein TadD
MTLKSLTSATLLACALAFPLHAAGSDSSDNSSPAAIPATGDLAEARLHIKAGAYKKAFAVLADLANGAGQNDPEVWNLLGFTSRKMKHWDDSEKYYKTALQLDPNHIGTLEYQGELFVQTGRIDAAKANLVKLQTLCGTCEEAQDLAVVIAKAGS